MEFVSNFLRRLPALTDARWLGHLLFLMSAMLAAWFYQERMCILDGGVYSFELILTEDFFTPHNRWGNYMIQWLPLLVIKMGASLKTILIVQSISFVLFYYFVFLFATYLCRRPELGWAILLLQLLVLHRTYFWPVSEVFHSVILGIGVVAWFTGGAEKKWWLYYSVAALLTWLMLILHPVAPAIIAFGVGLTLLENHNWRKWQAWILPGVVAAVYVGWKGLGPAPSDYELEILARQPSWMDTLTNLRGFSGYWAVWLTLKGELRMIPNFLVITFVVLLFQRKWLLAGFLPLFSFVYFLAVVRSYPQGESALLIHNVCIPLGMFAMVIAVRHILPRLRLPGLQLGLLVFLLFFFHHNISQRFELNRTRLAWHQSMADFSEEVGARKLILHPDHFPSELIRIPWAVACESLLLSSVDGPEGSMQVYHMAGREELLKPENGIFFAFAPWWYKRWVVDLPPELYGLKEDAFYDLNEPILADCGTIAAEVQADKYRIDWEEREFEKKKRKRILVTVKNEGTTPLPSLKGTECGMGLGYFFEKDGEVYPQAPNHIPLTVNLPPGTQFQQLVDMYPPESSGEYTLHFLWRKNETNEEVYRVSHAVTVH